MKKIKARNLHRDLGYFYIGLIISFAFSGLLMNHRDIWHPEKYTTETKAITVKLPEENKIDEKYNELIIMNGLGGLTKIGHIYQNLKFNIFKINGTDMFVKYIDQQQYCCDNIFYLSGTQAIRELCSNYKYNCDVLYDKQYYEFTAESSIFIDNNFKNIIKIS